MMAGAPGLDFETWETSNSHGRGSSNAGFSEFGPEAGVYLSAAHAARELPKRNGKEDSMKYAGLLVMPAGFFLTLAALALFPDPPRRAAFVLCGLAVEGLGLTVAVRGHMLARRASGL